MTARHHKRCIKHDIVGERPRTTHATHLATFECQSAGPHRRIRFKAQNTTDMASAARVGIIARQRKGIARSRTP